MVKKLISRSDFARLVGVSPSAVTLACKTSLAAACSEKQINPDHPAARAYMVEHRPPAAKKDRDDLPGIDVHYADALAYANSIGRVSTNSLQTKFSIGYARAKKLGDMLKASGAFKPVAATDPQPASKPFTPVQEYKPLAASPKFGGDQLRQGAALATLIEAPGEDDQLPMPEEFLDTGVDDLGNLTLRELVSKYGTAERFKVWLQAYKSLVDIGAKEIANAEKRGKLIPRDFVETHIIGSFGRTHINLLTDGAQTIARQLMIQIKAGATVEDCEVYVENQISRHIREAKDNIARVLRDA